MSIHINFIDIVVALYDESVFEDIIIGFGLLRIADEQCEGAVWMERRSLRSNG